jgi:CRP/FNR family cyclic AMP-dependent transcriptional regulator
MSVRREYVKMMPHFSGLSVPEYDAIGQYLHEKRVSKGEILLFEGDNADTLYFVIEGVVKVYKTSTDGKEQILQIIRPGESFNDVPVFSGEVNLASAEAMSNVSVYAVKKSDMENILKEYPQVAMNVIQILSQRVIHLVSLVEDLSFRNVTGRVAKVLLEYAGDGSDDKPRLTQQEMAAMIGTAREMVGRSLKTLEEEGSIRMERNRVVIINPEMLQALAGTNK